MKKLILLFTILSMIGCRKEIIEIKGEDVLVYTSSDYEREYYFIGTFGEKAVSIFDSQQIGLEIMPHPTNPMFVYNEKLYVFRCHGNSVTVNFQKSFSDSLVSEEQRLSIYQLGELHYGNVKTGTDGFTISYRDSQLGELWSSENGLQSGKLSYIQSIGLSYGFTCLRRIEISVDCNVYNSEGEMKTLKGMFASDVSIRL